MTTVIRDDRARAALIAAKHPSGLVVSVGPVAPPGEPMAHVGVSARDPELARSLVAAMTHAIRAAVPEHLTGLPVVRVSSRKALAQVGEDVPGAIAVVRVTSRNLRVVGEIVERLRSSGVAGVQLVWDGVEPSRDIAEPKVFAILERARATPKQAPVILAHGRRPVEALRILVDARRAHQ